MTRGVRLYLVGSFVLVSLAGCGRGLFQTAEREPWRAEAEIACLKSGAVKETPDLVRIDPISGPGVCGAEFPLKVAALGESGAFGYADDLRPPGDVGGGRGQPPWPGNQPRYTSPSQQPYQQGSSRAPQPNYPATRPAYGSGPVPLNAPDVVPAQADINLPPDGAMPAERPPAENVRYPDDNNTSPAPAQRMPEEAERPLPRLGPGAAGNVTGSVGPVAIKPVATLACPIVSALDRWLAENVQPAAQRWFGQRVVAIKQISAYSCRGMNGNPNAHISEHAFGNALDVAGFTLADGRYVSVKTGWKGLPEEQGFLRDVQGGACQIFNTVLAPGSNVYHYDHIHVDLMRRHSRPVICKPAAVSGEEIAGRAQQRSPYANSHGGSTWSGITGALGGRSKAKAADREEDEDD